MVAQHARGSHGLGVHRRGTHALEQNTALLPFDAPLFAKQRNVGYKVLFARLKGQLGESELEILQEHVKTPTKASEGGIDDKSKDHGGSEKKVYERKMWLYSWCRVLRPSIYTSCQIA